MKAKIGRLTKFRDIYEIEYYPHLEIIRQEICSLFSNFLTTSAEKNDFLYFLNDSVGKKYSFEVTSRTKKSYSLYEKFLRKNEVYRLDGLELVQKNNELETFINSIDDILGIRILVELPQYSNQILEFLKKENENLNKLHIHIDFSSSQEKMKNGLDIIKLKSVYSKENVCFELQIKSRLNSVWGDLEHTFFYKDYNMYIEKDNNRQIMNKLGYSVNNVDEIIEIINLTREEEIKEYQFKHFCHIIDLKFSDKILSELKVRYNLQTTCQFFLECGLVSNDLITKIDRMNLDDFSIFNLKFSNKNSNLKLYRKFLSNDLHFLINYKLNSMFIKNKCGIKELEFFRNTVKFGIIKELRISDESINKLLAHFENNHTSKLKNDAKLTDIITLNLILSIINTSNGFINRYVEDLVDQELLSIDYAVKVIEYISGMFCNVIVAQLFYQKILPLTPIEIENVSDNCSLIINLGNYIKDNLKYTLEHKEARLLNLEKEKLLNALKEGVKNGLYS